MPPTHSALRPKAYNWRDVHHANDPVSCTRYEVVPRGGTVVARLAEIGGAVQAVVQHAFDGGQPLRVPGGSWSLSSIAKPKTVVLDIANHNTIGAVPPAWLSPAYERSCKAAGLSPMLMAAGATIRVVHRELAKKKLALQTCGASNGQTLAGAIATGTHGADLNVGALHDTVLALHLVVGPNQSVLVQPSSGPLTDKSAETLGRWFGIPCELKSDDQLFRAALVHLGSLGVVLNVVVEAVPLFYLHRRTSAHRNGNLRWRPILKNRHPNGADLRHPANPDYLQYILHPYLPLPDTEPRAWLISMQKLAFKRQAGVMTAPGPTSLKSDLADFLPALVHLFEANIELPGNPLLRAATSAQLSGIYGTAFKEVKALPSVMFGDPDFLGLDFGRLRGASAEYVFNGTQARAGVELILDTLAAQASKGNQYLGGIGVRFVKGSDAFLAMNARKVNCYVELQSLFTAELPAIHTAIGRALTRAQIPFCGHWGQYEMNTPAVSRRWWGTAAIAAWKAARERLLTTAKARKVFASPILGSAGLG